MDMVLKRLIKREDGILSSFESDDIVSFKSMAIEHAYTDERGGWAPKIAPGFYKCTRYMSPKHGYEVFLINNVPDFQGKPVSFCEIHIGNFGADSDGCLCLGQEIDWNETLMVGDSKVTFDRFMTMQAGVNEFNLSVVDYSGTVGAA